MASDASTLAHHINNVALIDQHVHGCWLRPGDRRRFENALNEANTEPLVDSGFDSQLGFAVRAADYGEPVSVEQALDGVDALLLISATGPANTASTCAKSIPQSAETFARLTGSYLMSMLDIVVTEMPGRNWSVMLRITARIGGGQGDGCRPSPDGHSPEATKHRERACRIVR